MKVATIVFSALLILAAPSAAHADDFDDGAAAYQKKDYQTAMKLWRPLAEKGDADAQNNLGFMYSHGEGVRQDHAEAAKWWRLAAEQGYAQAEYSLGRLYDDGDSVEQDYGAAAKWYAKAADQGEKKAENNLGYLYDHGQGVKQDYAQAAKLYRAAADQGFAEAQFNLGLMYENGEGLDKSNVEAFYWLSLSVNAGRDAATKDRDQAAAALTAEQKADVEKRIAEWKPVPAP